VLNQGPTKLDYCNMDYSVLANCFRGNCPLKATVFSGTAVGCGTAESVPGLCTGLNLEQFKAAQLLEPSRIHCEVTFLAVWVMLQVFLTQLDRV
jgi:hypothetical protein